MKVDEVFARKLVQATETLDEVFADVECEILFQAMANVLARMLYENLSHPAMREEWMNRFVSLVGTVIGAYLEHEQQERDNTP